MRITIITLICIFLFYPNFVDGSRTNVTDFYSQLLGRKTTYQAWSGYEDIDWFYPASQASVYYSLWECSTKRLSDHSVPVVFYLQGGPGVSSQFAAFREIGPLQITKNGGNYSATENPWSWNYFSHLVFVDQPVGTGFSYNKLKTVDGTIKAANHFNNFIANFLKNTPWGLRTNPIYLAGEGYAGHFLPAFSSAVNQNKTMDVRIQGIILGGGLVDPQRQINNYQSFLSSAGIISNQRRDVTSSYITQSIINMRNGNFRNIPNLLENVWSQESANEFYNGMNIHNYRRYIDDTQGSDYVGFLNANKKNLGVPDDIVFIESNEEIKQAFLQDMLHSFTASLEDILQKDLRILIYNGQNDFKVTTAGVVTYMQNLNWKGAKEWREAPKQIWKESGKIMGWIKKTNNLVFVVLRNTGHYIYEDETTAARGAWLMLSNFFTLKW